MATVSMTFRNWSRNIFWSPKTAIGPGGVGAKMKASKASCMVAAMCMVARMNMIMVTVANSLLTAPSLGRQNSTYTVAVNNGM